MSGTATIGKLTVGVGRKPLLIAGPCVIESADATLALAESIASLDVIDEFQFVFKASYLKDNRSSAESYRGPGLHEGLEILSRVRERVGCPVLSDVHTVGEVSAAAEVLDVLQIPAFLCRQTSLIEAAGGSGVPVNVKKGQFMSPEDMGNVVAKLRGSGASDVLLTERGTSFGYRDLVVDFRAFMRMRETGCPVVYDVTHSLQKPGALGDRSGGDPDLVPEMARAAAAVPVEGFFVETHPAPADALSDAASMVPLDRLETILTGVARVHALSREITASQGARR